MKEKDPSRGTGAGSGRSGKAARKGFLLRLPPELYEELRTWASSDLRSINAQIEFILREALRRRNGHSPGEQSGQDR